jgi:transcriptional regulator with XRE-family HTH domain
MAKKRTKLKALSDQLREIVETGPLTRYRIAKDSGVDASQLLRFMRGDGRLTNDSLDKIGEVLKLRLESDLEQ